MPKIKFSPREGIMTYIKQALFAACMIVAFTGSVTAQGIDFGIGLGIPLSPGQAGTSPGRVFNTAKDSNPTTALSPGQLFIKGRETNPTTALAPGHTFTNFGRSKK